MKTPRRRKVPSFKTWRKWFKTTEVYAQHAQRALLKVARPRRGKKGQTYQPWRYCPTGLDWICPRWLFAPIRVSRVRAPRRKVKSRVIFPDWVRFLAIFPDNSLIFPGVYHFPDNSRFSRFSRLLDTLDAHHPDLYPEKVILSLTNVISSLLSRWGTTTPAV